MTPVELDALTCSEAVEELARVRDEMDKLKLEEAALEAHVLRLAEHREWVVERVGHVEIRQSNRYEWDTPLLWDEVVAQAKSLRRLDADDGVVESEGDAVSRALRSAMGKNPNWTAGGVAALDLPVDRYRTTVSGRRSVSIARLPHE